LATWGTGRPARSWWTNNFLVASCPKNTGGSFCGVKRSPDRNSSRILCIKKFDAYNINGWLVLESEN
jgi:hypothetical protein